MLSGVEKAEIRELRGEIYRLKVEHQKMLMENLKSVQMAAKYQRENSEIRSQLYALQKQQFGATK